MHVHDFYCCSFDIYEASPRSSCSPAIGTAPRALVLGVPVSTPCTLALRLGHQHTASTSASACLVHTAVCPPGVAWLCSGRAAAACAQETPSSMRYYDLPFGSYIGNRPSHAVPHRAPCTRRILHHRSRSTHCHASTDSTAEDAHGGTAKRAAGGAPRVARRLQGVRLSHSWSGRVIYCVRRGRLGRTPRRQAARFDRPHAPKIRRRICHARCSYK